MKFEWMRMLWKEKRFQIFLSSPSFISSAFCRIKHISLSRILKTFIGSQKVHARHKASHHSQSMVKTISSSASSSKIPVPAWILRHHSPSSIHSISFISNDPYPSNAQTSRSKSRKSKYVIASDSKGLISITRLKDYRPIAFWKAHGKGLDADGNDKARRSEEDSPVLGVEILKNGWILT